MPLMAAKGSTMRRLIIDPTFACNLKCITCHCHKAAGHYERQAFLTAADYESIIDQFVAGGGQDIAIYGGEPLLLDTVFDIIKYAKQQKLITGLSTNGILLGNKETLQRLIDARLDCLVVSINGIDDIYDIIVGRNAYKDFITALDTVARYNDSAKRKLRIWEFHVTVSRKNVTHLAEILPLAKAYGIRSVGYYYVSGVPQAIDTQTEDILGVSFTQSLNRWRLPQDIFIEEDQLPLLKQEIDTVKTTAKKLGINVIIDPALDEKLNARSLITGRYFLRQKCSYMEKRIKIGPTGDYYACDMLSHFPLANVKQEGLAAYWEKNETFNQIKAMIASGTILPVCKYCCQHGELI